MKLKDYEKVLDILEGKLLIGKSYGNNIKYVEEASVAGIFKVTRVQDAFGFLSVVEVIKNIGELIETYRWMEEEKSFDEYQKDLAKPITLDDSIYFLNEDTEPLCLQVSVLLELFSKGAVTEIEKSYLDKRNTKTPIESINFSAEDGNYSIVPVSVTNVDTKEDFSDDSFEIDEEALTHAERREETDKHKAASKGMAITLKRRNAVTAKKVANREAKEEKKTGRYSY